MDFGLARAWTGRRPADPRCSLLEPPVLHAAGEVTGGRGSHGPRLSTFTAGVILYEC